MSLNGNTPTMSTLESRLDSLESEVSRLRNEVTRLEEKRAIEELMSRHAINHVQKNMSKSVNFFALDEPDVTFEVGDRGVYVGAKALRTLFGAQYGSAALHGNLLIQYVTTGSVQIARDGKTAKGMWRCLHVEAVVPREGGEPDPIWACGAYAVDFIKKGSEWKIWHLHWFRSVKASHYTGWVKDKKWAFGGALPNSPDLGQTTYHNPYTPESIQDSVPPCPLPYDSYDGPEWMTIDQAKLWEG